eukprot:c3738_g1_i1.p1 GENE.c3738_g1_i1~~c3738_g1_i1.p1  ORF type:complete len:285 (+),score=47.11 c3738_g1_i1:41-895(+)
MLQFLLLLVVTPSVSEKKDVPLTYSLFDRILTPIEGVAWMHVLKDTYIAVYDHCIIERRKTEPELRFLATIEPEPEPQDLATKTEPTPQQSRIQLLELVRHENRPDGVLETDTVDTHANMLQFFVPHDPFVLNTWAAKLLNERKEKDGTVVPAPPSAMIHCGGDDTNLMSQYLLALQNVLVLTQPKDDPNRFWVRENMPWEELLQLKQTAKLDNDPHKLRTMLLTEAFQSLTVIRNELSLRFHPDFALPNCVRRSHDRCTLHGFVSTTFMLLLLAARVFMSFLG